MEEQEYWLANINGGRLLLEALSRTMKQSNVVVGLLEMNG